MRVLTLFLIIIVILTTQTSELPQTTTKCRFCHFIVNTIKYEVKEANATIDDIIHIVKDLCKDIGGPIISKECDFFLDKIETIVKWISEGIAPNQICCKLKICQNNNANYDISEFKQPGCLK